MNTAQVKTLTWSAAAVLGVGLVAYIGLFLKQRERVMTPVSTKTMLEVLQNVPEVSPRVDNIVAYAKVQKGMQHFDWTGKPPPEPVAPEVTPEIKHGPDPMNLFVQVRGIKIDADQ